MKRLLLYFGLVALAVSVAYAQPMMGGPLGRQPAHFKLMGEYGRAEGEAFRAEFADKTLGDLSGSEIVSWADRFSVARQKDAWIAASMHSSMMFPGKGQFMNGDGLGGGLFTAAHLATIAGTAVAWYMVLPADLKFDQLNYLADTCATIAARWRNKSLNDYLPSIGVMAGGMALDMVWRVWSAHSALSLAKAGIDEGKVKFEPFVGPAAMGMMLRY